MALENPEPVIGAVDDLPQDDIATVVLVEPSEDVAAICGRVDGAPTWAVVVHAASGNRQLSTELGMRRLLHHCQDSGKAIAIATRSSSLASRARELGVPVARKPQQVRWDAGGRRVVSLGRMSLAPPSIGRYVQGAVILGVALLGLFLVFALAPSATVVAYPPTETVTDVVSITASESRTEADFASMQLPASKVSLDREFTLAVPATGTAQVGTTPAKVGVTITNGTAATVVVAAGTVVLAGPEFIPFSLDETVNVPANASASGTATALNPGVSGNVPAAAVAGWQAEKFRFLRITNPQPAAGGASEPRPAVDPKDVLGLRDLARALQQSDTVKQALTEARPHDAVFLGTAQTSADIGEVTPAVGAPADVAMMVVTIHVSALAISAETLEALAQHVLSQRADEGEFVPGSVRARETGARQLDAESGLVKTEVQVQGELARGVTRDGLRDAVKGKSESGARSILSTRYGIQDADVRLSGWAPRLPLFGFRIETRLAAREAPPAGAAAFDAKNSPTTAVPSASATPGP